ncbi:hypothetical protein WCLP8_130008 [uncultured Gammaproteobacteria bacterium]
MISKRSVRRSASGLAILAALGSVVLGGLMESGAAAQAATLSPAPPLQVAQSNRGASLEVQDLLYLWRSQIIPKHRKELGVLLGVSDLKLDFDAASFGQVNAQALDAKTADILLDKIFISIKFLISRRFVDSKNPDDYGRKLLSQQINRITVRYAGSQDQISARIDQGNLEITAAFLDPLTKANKILFDDDGALAVAIERAVAAASGATGGVPASLRDLQYLHQIEVLLLPTYQNKLNTLLGGDQIRWTVDWASLAAVPGGPAQVEERGFIRVYDVLRKLGLYPGFKKAIRTSISEVRIVAAAEPRRIGAAVAQGVLTVTANFFQPQANDPVDPNADLYFAFTPGRVISIQETLETLVSGKDPVDDEPDAPVPGVATASGVVPAAITAPGVTPGGGVAPVSAPAATGSPAVAAPVPTTPAAAPAAVKPVKPKKPKPQKPAAAPDAPAPTVPVPETAPPVAAPAQ